MSYVHKILITTLLQYSLAAQDNVKILFDEEIITCYFQNYTWYKYGSKDVGLYYEKINTSKTNYQVPNGGGIFACEPQNESSVPTTTTTISTCNSCITFIIPSKGNAKHKANENNKSITKEIGQNVSLDCQHNTTGSFVVFWIAVYPNGTNQCLCSAEILRDTGNFNSIINKFCHPTVGMKERSYTSKSANYMDTPQYLNLTITSIATFDNGHYLCVIYSWKNGGYTFEISNNQSLQVTGNQDTKPPTGAVIYTAAGTIGGAVALVGSLFLTIFCIKTKGKQVKANQSPPNANDLPDDYECTPYAVSERKEENSRAMYSLAQSPKLASEYSEVELKSLAAPGAEYSEISLKSSTVASAEYSEIELKPRGSDAGATYYMLNNIYK